MGTVYIVHGCPDDEEDKTYNKHWMPWLKSELEAQAVHVEMPLMPEPWQPNYKLFRETFEKFTVEEDDILVGHSCGCAFLVRWLGDSKQKVQKLILVAPWKITNIDDPFRKEFYGYDIDESVKERVGKVSIFTADDEMEDGKKSAKIYHDALGGELIELKGRGHYTFNDMGTEEFPELRDAILS